MRTVKKMHYPVVRRSLLLSGILLGLAAASLPAQAAPATIVPETWYSAGVAGVPVSGDGIQFTTDGNTGNPKIQHMLTYFDPVSLVNAGDSISVSLKFSGEIDALQTSRFFGFAFYNSDDTRISRNGVGQGNAVFNGYRGYRVGVRTASGAASPFELRARSGNNNTLANTNSAHNTNFGVGGPEDSSAFASDTLYNVNYTITRQSATELVVGFTISGGGLSNYTGTWNIVSTTDPFYTTFDTFAISLGNENYFSTLTLYDVVITPPIPEPATIAALMGVGALALAVYRRRRG